MSTQKSTVLEMIAYRGTQLIDDETKKLTTFELTDKIAQNLFNKVHQRAKGTSKKQAIQDYLRNEPTFKVLTIKDAKNNSLSPLVAILENKSKLPLKNQFEAFKALSIQKISDQEVLNIWLNIIHQMFTSTPSFVTDDLIKILRGNHVIDQKITTIEDFKKVLSSKAVFPKELLDESYHYATWDPSENETNSSNKSIVSTDEEKNLNVVQAETMIDSLQKILPKLDMFQKDFDKSYKKAYASNLKEFEIKSEPIIREYQKNINASISSSFEKLGEKVIKYTTDNPYLQPIADSDINLPKFEFEMERPMDLKHIEQSLNEHEINLLLFALDYDFSIEKGSSTTFLKEGTLAYSEAEKLLTSFSDYNEWSNAINNKITRLNQQVIENTTVGQQLVKIGSYYVPVINENNSQPFTYKLASKTNSLQENTSLLFHIPNVQDEIKSISYSRTVNGIESKGEITADKFIKKGNALFVSNFDKINGVIQTDKIYKIDFNLENGGIYKIKDTILSPDKSTGGNITSDTNTPEITEDSLLEPYTPSGFGIKQLGVADYKRVEQTVKCYVEGEVSHIENIMAREYREKSSRTLRRNENTTIMSKTSEQEQIKDTASTSRFEMQTELSKITREDQNFAANLQASYGFGDSNRINAGTSYASNNSQENSSRQSIQKAQELTERAVNRITTSVLEERVNTVIEEYEENNRHGFDNREGENHVVGVYRWVDKLYNNQMVNYGKRMMFEFMIPEPARIHKLGIKNSATVIMPQDPRTALLKQISNAGNLTKELADFWAAKYNAQISSMPEQTIYTGSSLAADIDVTREVNHISFGSVKETIELPDGYKAIGANATISAVDDGDPRNGKGIIVNIGNIQIKDITKSPLVNYTSLYQNISSFNKTVPVSVTFANYFSGSIAVSIKCQLTAEALQQWQYDTFNAIITAYEEALEKYKTEVSVNDDNKDKTNPLFYRQIENIALRKNCISYLLNEKVMGGINMHQGNTASTYKVLMKKNLDKYASLVKFLEQAFEWDIMSYTFYPYYWANRSEWNNLYQFNESDDALFRAFMQSGMARVIATVRPGFEAAVGWFLQTGEIWNGSEEPEINDDLYISVLAELTNVTATEEGEPWITRVPTTLTILQAQSIGLEVTSALPCDCDGEECDSNFKLSDSKLGVPPAQV